MGTVWKSVPSVIQTAFAFYDREVRKMKIFAVAVLVVIAGDSQAMGACTDTLPVDLATNNCQQHTCTSLAAANHCGSSWGTCSEATGAIGDYCQMSCGNCPCEPYSEEACRQVATTLGLAEGGAGYSMVGSYDTKGCYSYKSGKYAGMVYYGTCGSGDWCEKKMEEIPSDGNQYRPNGFDCSVGCHPYSEDACRNAVAGLALGGKGYGFVGSYGNKGCYAYSSGKYSGMAYYSTGGNNADMAKPLSGAMYRPAGYDCN